MFTFALGQLMENFSPMNWYSVTWDFQASTSNDCFFGEILQFSVAHMCYCLYLYFNQIKIASHQMLIYGGVSECLRKPGRGRKKGVGRSPPYSFLVVDSTQLVTMVTFISWLTLFSRTDHNPTPQSPSDGINPEGQTPRNPDINSEPLKIVNLLAQFQHWFIWTPYVWRVVTCN